MKLKIFLLLILISLMINVTNMAKTQEEHEAAQARDCFLVTRPNNPTPTKTNKSHISTKDKLPNSKQAVTPQSSKNNKFIGGLGLGYTLYLRDANGRAVRVDPGREFHSGDAIRITLEPNSDGYLYIFHTDIEGESIVYSQNDGQPILLFPDARLNKGDNRVRAHVPYQVPSALDPNPQLHWFIFYQGKPSIERLYVVLTRQPLPGVPSGEALLNYCRANKNACPWKPPSTLWAKIKEYAAAPTVTSKSKVDAERQSEQERRAISRGLGLSQDELPPTLIYMNASAQREILVKPIILIHN